MPYTGESLSNVSTALATTFSQRLRRQWNRSAVTAKLLAVEAASGQGGGKQIGWDVAFSGAAAASFAEGSAIGSSEAASDVNVPAVLPFGWYRSTFQLSNLEIKAAKGSVANASALGRIVWERLDGSLGKIASVGNTDLFTGTGTDGGGNPNIIGLQAALAATGSYAGLSKATYSEWAGNVLANGGTSRPLTQDLLYNLDQLIFSASGTEAKAIVCSPGVYRKYAGLFEAIKRVMVGPNGEAPKYEGGERELSWKGMPVIRDRNCPSGYLYMLNTDDIRIRPLTEPANEDGIGMGPMAAISTNGEESSPTPFICDVYPLGRVGSSIQFVAETYVQLQVQRVNTSGFVSDISEV
jgi:hypothetical protein